MSSTVWSRHATLLDWLKKNARLVTSAPAGQSAPLSIELQIRDEPYGEAWVTISEVRL